MLARNFKTIEKTTLYLAFFINVILLFHRVDIKHTESGGLSLLTARPQASFPSFSHTPQGIMAKTIQRSRKLKTMTT